MALRKRKSIVTAAENNMSITYKAIGATQFENLPGTLIEIETLEKLFYNNKNTKHIFKKSNATEDNIKSISNQGKLKQYQLIHFSAHGFLSIDFPQLSSIVLTQDNDIKEDGYLRMREIVNLNLDAKLVVLSACETGLGKEIKGEGLIGLTRAFIFAGTKNIIVSLWSVADNSTTQFMIKFYQLLNQGKSINHSLRLVKLEFIKNQQWRHPYFWSPFILYGTTVH